MLENILPLLLLPLFSVAAYYIKQSATCACSTVSPSEYSFMLGFSYYMIAYYIVVLICGKSFINLILTKQFLFIIPLFSFFGTVAWSILTVMYVRRQKACKCPDSVAEEIAYGLAITELVSFGIIVLAITYFGYGYTKLIRSK